MQTGRVLDQFDIEAEREGLSISRFRKEIGESAGRIGTPRHKAKKRPCGKGTNAHHYEGAKTGVWRGLPS